MIVYWQVEAAMIIMDVIVPRQTLWLVESERYAIPGGFCIEEESHVQTPEISLTYGAAGLLPRLVQRRQQDRDQQCDDGHHHE